MLLSKNGITVDVIHPADITRYKRLGYAELPAPKIEEPTAEKPKVERSKKPETKTAEKPKEGGEE